MKKKETKTETSSAEETLKTKRTTRTRKKAEAAPAEETQPAETPQKAPKETPKEAPQEVSKEAPQEKPAEKPARKRATKKKAAEEPAQTPEAPKKSGIKEPAPAPTPAHTPAPKPVTIPPMQEIKVHDFTDLVGQGGKFTFLNDQQIQTLTWEDAQRRCEQLEHMLLTVLDYDIVLSDTNIWLELLVGHSSSHSDPRVNARLQFERQLESLSKMMKRIGGRFMVMSETYEEIDRFATAQEPVSYKDADWTDEALCRNVAARLAKRLMLAQQKENRLRIEGIGSECHHASFADPAIIRRTVEFFATGKKVLLLTNDTSVGIRSLGMCDDLQRVGEVDEKTWHDVYEPQRPMVLTMDDLKLLDTYMRQYYCLCTAARRPWMQDATRREPVILEKPLELWLEGFRPGTRGGDRRSDRKEQQGKEQQRQSQANAGRKPEQKAAEQGEESKSPLKGDTEDPKGGGGSVAEAAAEETAAPETRKSRSRRGGRGRRGKKAGAENA